MKSKAWFSILGFFVGVVVGLSISDIDKVTHIAAEARPGISTIARPVPIQPLTPRSAITAQSDRSAYRDRIAALTDLNSFLRTKISLPLTSGEEVSEDFVNVFGLTSGEVVQLKVAFVAAKKQISELEATHASIKPEGEHAFTISIQPFPEEGGPVYDGLLQSIHDVLGDQRFAAYRAMSPDIDSSLFGMFGLSDTTIAIRPVKQGEKPTSTGSSSFDPDGTMKVRLDTNPVFFPTQYPAIYQKMVASGLWKANAP